MAANFFAPKKTASAAKPTAGAAAAASSKPATPTTPASAASTTPKSTPKPAVTAAGATTPKQSPAAKSNSATTPAAASSTVSDSGAKKLPATPILQAPKLSKPASSSSSARASADDEKQSGDSTTSSARGGGGGGGDDGGYILGIDEAGRGPVLGPMVYGICWCPAKKRDHLKALGFADSKTLTAVQRSTLFHKIKSSEYIGYEVDVLMPADLSAKMLRRNKVSLNAISHDSAIGLIQRVMDRGITVSEIYVDTVGIAEKYQEKLKKIFENVPTIVVSKKADSLFPIVSAASIAAKVTRDVTLEKWQFPEGAAAAALGGASELGSGYPADPLTKEWLVSSFDRVFGWPSLVRFSWQTCKTIVDKDAVDMDWGEVEEEGQKSVTSLWGSIASAGSSVGGSVALNKRHNFFKAKHMNVVTGFPKPVPVSNANGGGSKTAPANTSAASSVARSVSAAAASKSGRRKMIDDDDDDDDDVAADADE